MAFFMENSKLCIFVSIFFALLSYGCNGPELTTVEYDDIDTRQDPVQTSLSSSEIIQIKIKDGLFNIKPLAEYKASAKVVGRESYSSGWAAKISPLDLAIAWGMLAEPDNERYVSYSQSDRWYFFEYKPDSPFKGSYIIDHSSNNHIIPSNENVRKAVKSIKVNEKVILEGCLVNLTGNYEGQRVWWNTSLSRNDSGDHSCELLYLTRVRIGSDVYQ
jgi:hypothetical protein